MEMKSGEFIAIAVYEEVGFSTRLLCLPVYVP